MPVNMFVGVTNQNWFRFLRDKSRIGNFEEVNFWAPGGNGVFRALRRGELFLFKLKRSNFIAGYGVFTYANLLPLSLAWKAFGEGNGTQTEQELRRLIIDSRGNEASDLHRDFDIGCRLLCQPVFFDEQDWIRVPKSWKSNIVSGKTYDTGSEEGMGLWERLMAAAANHEVRKRTNKALQPDLLQAADAGARYGAPQLIEPRLGQGAFRVLVTETYQRRCAVSKERTLPVLEAAHIRSYASGGRHEASNGLLLRADIHKLFDDGYVTVTKDHRFEVSKKIEEEFGNGKQYYGMHGQKIIVPGDPANQPSKEALEWHNDNCYKG